VTIWRNRNPSIWLDGSAQIWPMKSAYSTIQGFDWMLVSRVVCINQIVTICQLRALNPYHVLTLLNRKQYILYNTKSFLIQECWNRICICIIFLKLFLYFSACQKYVIQWIETSKETSLSITSDFQRLKLILIKN
jgi:hypothetical protein